MARSELAKLKVVLEAESSRLQKGLDDANRKISRFESNVNRSARNIKTGFSNALAGLGTGLSIAGLSAFTKNALDSADQMQKLGIRLGISTEALSQYRHVADLTGVSQKTLELGFQRMTRRVSEAAAGTGEARKALAELRIDVQKLNQLTPDEQFEALADAMEQVEAPADRVRLAMKLFDTEGVALVQTMQGGSEAIRAMRQEADELGLTLSQSTADAAASANDALTRLGVTGKALGITLISAVAPAIETVADSLSSTLSRAINSSSQDIDDLRLNLERLRAETEEFGPLGVRGGAITASARTSIVGNLEKQILGNLEGQGGLEGLRTKIDRFDNEIADAKKRIAEFQAELATIPESERVEGRLSPLGERGGRIETPFSAINDTLQSTTKELERITAEREKAFEKLEKIELGFESLPAPENSRPARSAPTTRRTATADRSTFDALKSEADRITASLQTPAEQFEAAIRRFSELRGADKLSAETHVRAIEKSTQTLFESFDSEGPQEAFGEVVAEFNRLREQDLIGADEYLSGVEAAQERLNLAMAGSNADLTDFANTLEELHRPVVALGEDLAKVQEVFDAGLIDEDLYKQSVQGIIEELNKLEEKTQDVGNQWQELGPVFQSAFEDAIVEGEKLSDVLKALLKDITRIATRKLVTEPIGNALGGFFGGGASGGGFDFAKLFSGLTGAATGADFTVGPTLSPNIGGIDNRVLAMRVADGERVTVTPKNEVGRQGGGITIGAINIMANDLNSFRGSEAQVAATIRRAATLGGRNS